MGVKITDLSADTTPTTDDLVVTVNDPSGTPGTKKVTLAAVGTLLNKVVQTKNTQTGTLSTGTTQIPLDNTIPQNTEGDEYMTLSVTPTSATNKLKIDVVVYASNSTNSRWLIAALFQDSTANALACGFSFSNIATELSPIVFTHYMTSGTTSSTTFKVRVGSNSTGTTAFNSGGNAGAAVFGGVLASSITITELVP